MSTRTYGTRILESQTQMPDNKALHRSGLRFRFLGVVREGATVHTDGYPAYGGLVRLGYGHDVTALIRDKQKGSASRLLPRVHRVASLLKRWLLGTHQGAVSPEHLEYYLDEFTFRFNRRTSRSRGKLFYRLLQQAMQIEPAPYKSIVGGTKAKTQDAGVGGVN